MVLISRNFLRALAICFFVIGVLGILPEITTSTVVWKEVLIFSILILIGIVLYGIESNVIENLIELQKNINYFYEDHVGKPIKKIKVKGKKEVQWRTWNENYCWFCGNKFSHLTDRFSCHYCSWNFCSKHRLPEKHKCKGSPVAPSAYRGRYVYGPGDRTSRLE